MKAQLRVEAGPLTAVALLAVIGVLIALVLQHAYGYAPCPWCSLQRLIHLLIALLALVALALRRQRRLASALAAGIPVLALAGSAAALHQHSVAAASDSCALTLADRVMGSFRLPELWPMMFEATARCDEANLPWLGIPFALWSLGLFMVLLLIGLRAFRYRPPSMFLR
jgi:disulfide bond formation protein DsbB